MIDLMTRPSSLRNRAFWENAVLARSRPHRGPEAVARSLRAGLTQLQVPFRSDPWRPAAPTLHALGGASTLRWAIGRKQSGRVQTLVAGPNIVVTPADEGGVAASPEIDGFLVPSEWVKDFYLSVSPALEGRIFVWPAGVEDPGPPPSQKTGTTVGVYVKRTPDAVLQEVRSALREAGLPFAELRYGEHRIEDYHRFLSTCRFMVFLSPSESQGLALQEAWVRDVPTLAWSPGVWRHNGVEWRDPLISAPCLTPEAGSTFAAGDFQGRLADFLRSERSFKPARGARRHLTDAASAAKYLEILRGLGCRVP